MTPLAAIPKRAIDNLIRLSKILAINQLSN
nr:MAG TPA: hypothetical protein [Caudoviricetes sp.]